MASLSGFSANKTPPMDDYSPVPEGEYRALITASQVKETKAHNGSSFLEFTWELLDEPYRKRRLWTRLNLWNQNQQAVDIAQKELSSICRAINVLEPKDSEELHGIPIILRVGTELRADNGEMTNRIRGYKALNTSAPVVAAPVPVTPSAPAPAAPQVAPAPRAAVPTTPPWRQ